MSESRKPSFYVENRPRSKRYLIAVASEVQVFRRNRRGQWVRRVALADADVLKQINVSEIAPEQFKTATSRDSEKEIRALERKVNREAIRRRQPEIERLYRGSLLGAECFFMVKGDRVLYYSLEGSTLRSARWVPSMTRGDRFREANDLEALVLTGQHNFSEFMRQLRIDIG